MGLSLLLPLIYLALLKGEGKCQGRGKERYLEPSTAGTSWGAGSVPEPLACLDQLQPLSTP